MKKMVYEAGQVLLLFAVVSIVVKISTGSSLAELVTFSIGMLTLVSAGINSIYRAYLDTTDGVL